ncbi:hypothetical protein [Herbaspirillum sp. alder98]|uniref:hypothetical protein n=1 Tax=Herbaspirillum sp. alder98 TaxID=2913096 RepID=UPI001CD8E0A8|nr:hypothetical protein [Herbaspirillum sp. alder98]MCA1323590.1 hypothetical protein [Herbaspirillum sp. alder98]
MTTNSVSLSNDALRKLNAQFGILSGGEIALHAPISAAAASPYFAGMLDTFLVKGQFSFERNPSIGTAFNGRSICNDPATPAHFMRLMQTIDSLPNWLQITDAGQTDMLMSVRLLFQRLKARQIHQRVRSWQSSLIGPTIPAIAEKME